MKKFLMFGIALLAAVPATVAMGGSSTDRATGGGQVLIGTRGGAGDTIAFTAQDRAKNPGQVQYVDRTATGQTTYHGTVLCLEVTGPNNAKLAGTWRDGGSFEIRVQDNGEGAGSNDMIAIQAQETSPECGSDDDDDDNPLIALARGNAQVYNAP